MDTGDILIIGTEIDFGDMFTGYKCCKGSDRESNMDVGQAGPDTHQGSDQVDEPKETVLQTPVRNDGGTSDDEPRKSPDQREAMVLYKSRLAYEVKEWEDGNVGTETADAEAQLKDFEGTPEEKMEKKLEIYRENFQRYIENCMSDHPESWDCEVNGWSRLSPPKHESAWRIENANQRAFFESVKRHKRKASDEKRPAAPETDETTTGKTVGRGEGCLNQAVEKRGSKDKRPKTKADKSEHDKVHKLRSKHAETPKRGGSSSSSDSSDGEAGKANPRRHGERDRGTKRTSVPSAAEKRTDRKARSRKQDQDQSTVAEHSDKELGNKGADKGEATKADCPKAKPWARIRDPLSIGCLQCKIANTRIARDAHRRVICTVCIVESKSDVGHSHPVVVDRTYHMPGTFRITNRYDDPYWTDRKFLQSVVRRTVTEMKQHPLFCTLSPEYDIRFKPLGIGYVNKFQKTETITQKMLWDTKKPIEGLEEPVHIQNIATTATFGAKGPCNGELFIYLKAIHTPIPRGRENLDPEYPVPKSYRRGARYVVDGSDDENLNPRDKDTKEDKRPVQSNVRQIAENITNVQVNGNDNNVKSITNSRPNFNKFRPAFRTPTTIIVGNRNESNPTEARQSVFSRLSAHKEDDEDKPKKRVVEVDGRHAERRRRRRS